MKRRAADVYELAVGRERLVVVSLPAGDELPAGALTRAEREVAADVIAGLTTAQIARRRRRSPRTIANQLASIYRKLGVSSRAELAKRANLR